MAWRIKPWWGVCTFNRKKHFQQTKQPFLKAYSLLGKQRAFWYSINYVMTVAIESNTHIMLAPVLLHVKETGRKRSSARLTPCAMFKTSYSEATACQVQSNFNLLCHSPGFKPLPLHPLTQLVQGSHTSCLVSCLESAQFLAVLTVFQFRSGRVQSVTHVKVSSFSLETDWPFSAAQMWVCALSGTMASDQSCSWHYSVAGRDVVIGRINSHSWLNDAENLDS